MLTIVETNAYLARAKSRLTDEERVRIVEAVAQDPAGAVHLGAGLYKMRFGISGRGKSGGVRVVYYYRESDLPAFLLTVFAKNEKSNLSRAEFAELARIAGQIAANYGTRR